jgi:hypothetical protein
MVLATMRETENPTMQINSDWLTAALFETLWFYKLYSLFSLCRLYSPAGYLRRWASPKSQMEPCNFKIKNIFAAENF